MRIPTFCFQLIDSSPIGVGVTPTPSLRPWWSPSPSGSRGPSESIVSLSTAQGMAVEVAAASGHRPSGHWHARTCLMRAVMRFTTRAAGAFSRAPGLRSGTHASAKRTEGLTAPCAHSLEEYPGKPRSLSRAVMPAAGPRPSRSGHCKSARRLESRSTVALPDALYGLR